MESVQGKVEVVIAHEFFSGETSAVNPIKHFSDPPPWHKIYFKGTITVMAARRFDGQGEPGCQARRKSDSLKCKDIARMADRIQQKKPKFETVEPLGKRVLIRKDEDKKVTKGGIELPDSIEIPTITGRIVAISAQIDHDHDFPIRQYDRVLFNPKHAIPVEFDAGNYLFVVPIEDVVAVFRTEKDTARDE